MAFEAITTQEQFDAAIEERLERERETIKTEYKDFMSPEDVQEKYKDYLSPEQVAEKDATIQKFERNSKKVQIAMKEGIPYELAEKISGDTEEDMEKDAKRMVGFLKKGNQYPEYDPEPNSDKKTKEAAIKKMLNGLKGE